MYTHGAGGPRPREVIIWSGYRIVLVITYVWSFAFYDSRFSLIYDIIAYRRVFSVSCGSNDKYVIYEYAHFPLPTQQSFHAAHKRSAAAVWCISTCAESDEKETLATEISARGEGGATVARALVGGRGVEMFAARALGVCGRRAVAGRVARAGDAVSGRTMSSPCSIRSNGIPVGRG